MLRKNQWIKCFVIRYVKGGTSHAMNGRKRKHFLFLISIFIKQMRNEINERLITYALINWFITVYALISYRLALKLIQIIV